jgi:hypothetical protein
MRDHAFVLDTAWSAINFAVFNETTITCSDILNILIMTLFIMTLLLMTLLIMTLLIMTLLIMT